MASLSRWLVDSTRPLDQPGRWWRLTPFGLVAALGVAAALIDSPRHPGAVLVAAAALVAVGVAAAILPWQRWPASAHAAPALAFLLMVLLLEYGTARNFDPYYLLSLPLVWLAIFHSRRLMLVGLAALAVVLFLPNLLAPEHYSARGWPAAVLLLVLLSLASLAVIVLVAAARAADRRARVDRDLLATYLNSAACLVVALDRAGRVALFNRYSEQLTGYSAAELLGRDLAELPDFSEPSAAAGSVLAGAGPAEAEQVLVARDGSQRHVLWSATGRPGPAGELAGVVLTGLDVTRQRTTEQVFGDVLAAATEQLIFATDTRGIFTVFNAGGERMLGYSAQELVGKQRADYIYKPGQMELVAEEFGADSVEDLIGNEQIYRPPMTRDWVMLHKDGSEVPVSLSFTEIRHHGRLSGHVVVARDIAVEREAATAVADALAAERAAAARLRELDEVKSSIVASVSHDLRTPLTSIVGNAEILLDAGADPLTGMQRRLLEAMARNARRLDRLVGDLLVLSRIESGTLQVSLQPAAIGQVIAGAMEALSAQRAGDVQVRVRLPEEPVFVLGDPDLLERVATNLLGNALKFTAPGGQVDISVTAAGEVARWSFADTGIGIPEEELPYVFDRFYRSSRSQSGHQPGSGLGLSIVKSIIDHHQGRIYASNNPGGGAVFTVELPMVTARGG